MLLLQPNCTQSCIKNLDFYKIHQFEVKTLTFDFFEDESWFFFAKFILFQIKFPYFEYVYKDNQNKVQGF